MDNSKPAQNIQDTFLNTARKERSNITVYLLSGVKLTGRIRSFDKYSVVLEANGQEQLIFKHAISTVVMGRAVSHGAHPLHDGKAVGAPAAGSSAASSAPGPAPAGTASAASASGHEV
jgi:host factor-I protein